MVSEVKTKSEPRVRFRGFDDEWEEVKLGDVFSDGFSGGTPKSTNESYYNGDIPFLNISDMSNRVISSTEKFITSDGLNNSSARLAPKGTVSLAMYASVGKVGIMGESMATSQAFYNMVFDNESVRDFIYTYLEKMDMMHGWDRWVSQGTQKNLNAGKIKNLKIKTPSSLPEQQKIGELFQTLDKSIDLSNTQVENLKQQKKALLQRLFPQKGETEPNVRLHGFTDTWEEVKLDDVLVKSDERSTENNQYPVMTSSRQGLFLQSDYFSHQVASKDNTGYRVIRKGEFTYRSMSDDNVFVFNQLRQHTVGIVSPAYVVFGLDGADGYYLKEYLNSSAFRRTMVKMIQGGTRTSYKYKSLIDTKVQLPSLDEQQAIGELFQTLDEQIRQAEDKVSQYKELKQALLQRLFV